MVRTKPRNDARSDNLKKHNPRQGLNWGPNGDSQSLFDVAQFSFRGQKLSPLYETQDVLQGEMLLLTLSLEVNLMCCTEQSLHWDPEKGQTTSQGVRRYLPFSLRYACLENPVQSKMLLRSYRTWLSIEVHYNVFSCVCSLWKQLGT